MLFLSRLFTKSQTEQAQPHSKGWRDAEIERLKREIRETVRIDPERAASRARAILARMGVEA